jgi:hypothetical protein
MRSTRDVRHWQLSVFRLSSYEETPWLRGTSSISHLEDVAEHPSHQDSRLLVYTANQSSKGGLFKLLTSFSA